jgi:N-acetylated-alpha-linked acidic dipeptidase
VDPDEVEGLPKIPAQPIGYEDARKLLEKMGGLDSPQSWKGGMDGISYKIGGEMTKDYDGWTVKLEVHNVRDTIKSSNVFGYITGSVEPDRYVMLGNHRDAWGYGAIDPSSGTAQLMEVVRSFGKMLKMGWRPRRTIVFASWAAEESGLEGSYEWVYEHLTKLMHRTVALINTDICVCGPIVKPRASPILRDVVIDSLKHSSDPTLGKERSYYEYWVEWTNQDNKESDKKKDPVIKHLGSGTDHAAFAFYAGIPAFDIDFDVDTKKAQRCWHLSHVSHWI